MHMCSLNQMTCTCTFPLLREIDGWQVGGFNYMDHCSTCSTSHITTPLAILLIGNAWKRNKRFERTGILIIGKYMGHNKCKLCHLRISDLIDDTNLVCWFWNKLPWLGVMRAPKCFQGPFIHLYLYFSDDSRWVEMGIFKGKFSDLLQLTLRADVTPYSSKNSCAAVKASSEFVTYKSIISKKADLMLLFACLSPIHFGLLNDLC